MKRFEIITTSVFDEILEELGIDAISDTDITDEIHRHEEMAQENGRIEVWNYENGILEVYLED